MTTYAQTRWRKLITSSSKKRRLFNTIHKSSKKENENPRICSENNITGGFIVTRTLRLNCWRSSFTISSTLVLLAHNCNLFLVSTDAVLYSSTYSNPNQMYNKSRICRNSRKEHNESCKIAKFGDECCKGSRFKILQLVPTFSGHPCSVCSLTRGEIRVHSSRGRWHLLDWWWENLSGL